MTDAGGTERADGTRRKFALSPLVVIWEVTRACDLACVHQSLSGLFGPAWLKVTGVSGVLELAALLLFGFNLWKTLDTETPEEEVAASWKPPIASGTKVGDLLAAYPDLLQVFVVNGFAALANPILRRTLARGVSIAQACRMHGVNLEAFLGQLTEARGRLRV